jgi:hypothetical protein
VSLNESPQFADVLEDGYVSGAVTVTTSAIEAKVGGSRQTGREVLYIENTSSVTIYYGPSGVTTSTGARLFKDQSVFLPVGNMAVYLIAASGSNAVIVQEFA